MTPVPVSPRRVFGVDFSAAKDAGSRTWVCRGHPGADGVRIESVDPIDALPGGATAREEAFRALVQKIVESPRSAWGLDFCFGLPQPVAMGIGTGAAPTELNVSLENVAACSDADEFRRRCADAADGAELRRRTDDEAATPFSPYNLRIYKQTFHGMTSVLKPLRSRNEIAVLPFDRLPEMADSSGRRLPFHHAASGRAPHIYLMEVCPASVLKALEYPDKGYKRADERSRRQRLELLQRLVRDGLVRPVARQLRDRITDDANGDALDAVLAAVGAWRGYRGVDHSVLHANPLYAAEGFVYA